MVSKATLQERVAQLEAAQLRAATLLSLSTRLNSAGNEAELLQIVGQPGLEAGAKMAYLLYIEMDETKEPEWAELVAASESEPVSNRTRPIETRYYLPEYALSQLWMANPREPLLVADTLSDERVDEKTEALLSQVGARALAILPLAWAGRWVGIVILIWETVHRFDAYEAQLYQDIISLATPVIENRRLLVEKERAVVAELFEISRGLSKARNAAELLRVLAQPSVEAGAYRAYLSYIDLNRDGEPEWVEIVANWWKKGNDPLPIGSRFYLPTFPFARLWIANPTEPQLISNAMTDQIIDEATRNLLVQHGTPATAIIPLAQAGRWVGLVGLAWDTPHSYSHQEIEIYRALMGLGTQAVENQRLFQHLEQLVEERTQALKEAQSELIRQEKLAALGQLAGGVAHELRNPLGVISNAVYFLKLISPDAEETTQEYLNLISSHVAETERIVAALLDFSHTRMPIPELVDVGQLVADVLTHHPPPEHIKVVTSLEPDLPAVYVDAPQIGQQVLPHLVTNAYQAMPEGGELTISALVDADRIKLLVGDSGAGMSPEIVGKIFEPLFTTKAKGIGLGLAVSKNLVEVNGGSLAVESVETKGTIFTISLPITKTP